MGAEVGARAKVVRQRAEIDAGDTAIAALAHHPHLLVFVRHRVQRRRRRGAGRNMARDIGIEEIVLRVYVGNGRQQLRMRGLRMMALHESFLRDLPIGANAFSIAPGTVTLVPPVWCEVLDHRAGHLLEAGRLRVHADEHEAAPGGDAGLRQTGVVRVPLRQIPGDRVVHEFAVQRPGDGVERADEMPAAAVVRDELAAAVQAGVEEGANPLAGIDNNEAAGGYLIVYAVACIGNFVHQARHLPDAGPQIAILLLEKAARPVALGGDRGRADVGHGGVAKIIGVAGGVALDDVSIRLARPLADFVRHSRTPVTPLMIARSGAQCARSKV